MKRRIISETEKKIRAEIRKVLENDLSDLKDSIMEGYDNLALWGADPESHANPDIYRESFKEKLDTFVYFENTKDGFTFALPNIESLDFSGIEVIRQILEGTIGEYYEISSYDAKAIDATAILTRSPISSDEALGEPYYLVEANEDLRSRVKELLGKDLIKFPFSNVPPLEAVVFDTVDKFAGDNKNKIDKAIKNSIQAVTKKFKRI